STSVTVTGSSAGGNAVTVTMYDSSNMVKSNGQLLLFPPAMWISLSSLNLVSAGKGSVTSLPMSTSNYYLLDTGTSLIYLVQDAYTSFKASFCPSVTALSTSSLHIACQVTSSGYFLVQITGVSSILSKTQLNSLFPNISFGITGANGTVNIRPSAYMLLEQYSLGSSNTNSNFLEYLVGIASAGSGSNQGILGNAWMVDLLIQETLSTRQLVITEVNSCNDISYGSSPATVASPPPTESPSPLPPSPPHSPPPHSPPPHSPPPNSPPPNSPPPNSLPPQSLRPQFPHISTPPHNHNSPHPNHNSQHASPNKAHPNHNSQHASPNKAHPNHNSQHASPNKAHPNHNSQHASPNKAHPNHNSQHASPNKALPNHNSQHASPEPKTPHHV
ncbi:hypothetical protein CEUSTIGMA_g1189.t1, partial [Chlamydomonas eustigma]